MSYPYILLLLTLYLVRALPVPNSLEPRVLLDTGYISVAEGFWGDWSEPMDVPSGTLACGLALRIEPPQGASIDDTSANAIKIIYCKIGDWNNYSYIQLNEGLWGTWEEKMCPKDYYINGVVTRLEKRQGVGDDTALNSLKFSCKEPIFGNSGPVLTLEKTYWGDWLKWVVYSGKYICGGQVRVESNQGSGDDTALNGLRVKFCSYSS